MNILGNVQALFQPLTTLASVATTLNLPGDHDRFSLTGSQSFSKLIGGPSDTVNGRIVILQGAASCTAVAQHTANPTTAGQMDLRTGDHTFSQGDILVLQGQANGTWRKIFQSFISAGNSGLLRAPQIKTSGTSYTAPANCNRIRVRLVGGGGGGGGTDSAASNASVGGGGGAAGYVEKYYACSPGAVFTYAIGAAGAAGANTLGNGGAGGDTTFTDGVTALIAPGGLGGIAVGNGTSNLFSLGGANTVAGTNGDVNGAGAPGIAGQRVSGTVGYSGSGGSGPFGAGGVGKNAAGAGNAGTGNGSGGSGGCVLNASTAVAGGAGTAGLLIIEEYS